MVEAIFTQGTIRFSEAGCADEFLPAHAVETALTKRAKNDRIASLSYSIASGLAFAAAEIFLVNGIAGGIFGSRYTNENVLSYAAGIMSIIEGSLFLKLAINSNTRVFTSQEKLLKARALLATSPARR